MGASKYRVRIVHQPSKRLAVNDATLGSLYFMRRCGTWAFFGLFANGVLEEPVTPVQTNSSSMLDAG